MRTFKSKYNNMEFRNSSPPPDHDDDVLSVVFVGGTSYEKLFVIDLAKRIVSKLNKYSSNDDDINNVDDDLDFDDDLCKLMDITIEPAILNYVEDFPFFEPFCDAICANKSERFNDLFIGIMSNLMSNEAQCDRISSNDEMIKLLLSFWSSPSYSFLLECNRLLRFVLKISNNLALWLNAIKHSQLLSHIIFILKSSTNSELIISTTYILGQIMESDEEICEKWISDELLKALLIARNEAEWSPDYDINFYHYAIHLFSTLENGIIILINNFGPLYSSLFDYINLLNDSDEEPGHLMMLAQYHNALRMILPTLDVTLSNMASVDALEYLQQSNTMEISDTSQQNGNSHNNNLIDNLVKLLHACEIRTCTKIELMQLIYQEICSFFNTVIHITYKVIKNPNNDVNIIKWLPSLDVGACQAELEEFLLCCIKDETTKQKLIEICYVLQLTYIQEGLSDILIK